MNITRLTRISFKWILITGLIIFMTHVNSNAQFWNLVWADEFSGPSIDSNIWNFQTGAGGWGNNELQYYTNRSVNSRIENGQLQIIGKKEQYQGSAYTSARLNTANNKTWKYGRIEARIKLPKAQGLWPAFWMLGENIGAVSWPYCGEIDMMEHVNSDDKIFGTMHWDNNGHAYYGGDTIINNVSAFHHYSIEWNASSIKWFVDGIKYHEANILNGINGTSELHNPHFILLNMAIGGNFPGNPTSTSVTSDTLFVDYIRVYQNQSFPASVVEQNTSSSITFSPNPIRKNETLCLYNLETGDHVLQMLDLTGREIFTRNIRVDPSSPHELKIDLKGIASGVYGIRLTNVRRGTFGLLQVVE